MGEVFFTCLQLGLLAIWATWILGDLDFGQLVYSNYWETCVLKNLVTWGTTWTFGNLGNLDFG
jgi:hypothetical protein